MVYSFEMDGDRGLLEVRFEAPDGGVVVEVIHSGLPETAEFDEVALGIESGWANALHYLRLYLAASGMRKRRVWVAVVEGGLDPERAMPWFEPGLKRERWLDVPVGELEPGWHCARHVTWMWPSIEGTLEMSAFQDRDGLLRLALRAVSWGTEDRAGLQVRLTGCVDRLAKLLVS